MSPLAPEDTSVEQLRPRIDGKVVTPDDPAYEEARRVWNGMIDRHPALIVQCASTSDVVAAVAFGRERDLVISVRCGAHSTPGYSTCDEVDWLQDLPDDAIDVIVEQTERLPAPFGQLILGPMGGAVGRTGNGEIALNMPHARWAYFCLSMWMDPSEDDRNRAWARGFAEAMGPFAVGTAAYPNFIAPDEGIERLRSSYGPEKYERLVQLKGQWDPENVFRLNQNIEPPA